MTVTDVQQDPTTLTLTIRSEYTSPIDRVWQMWADPRTLARPLDDEGRRHRADGQRGRLDGRARCGHVRLLRWAGAGRVVDARAHRADRGGGTLTAQLLPKSALGHYREQLLGILAVGLALVLRTSQRPTSPAPTTAAASSSSPAPATMAATALWWRGCSMRAVLRFGSHTTRTIRAMRKKCRRAGKAREKP